MTSSARGGCGARARRSRSSYDVVIIGGGSHGLATAYYLRAARDHRRRVLEKSYIGSGAAGRNTTILRSNYKTPEGARFYDASVKLYEGLSAGARLQPAVLPVRAPDARALRPRAVRDGQPRRGQPPAGHRLAADRARRGQAAGARDERRGPTRPIRSWARSTTRRAGSSATTPSSGASLAAPTRAAPRSTRTPRCSGLERSNGRVNAVRTNRGTIRAGQVINCTAGWSTLLCDMAGVALPITTHILQACVTEPVKPLLDVVIVSSQMHVYISQTDRGEFLMGAEIEPWTTYRMQGTLNFLQDVTRHTLELFPQLEHARLLRSWAGLCDLSPDYSPILGQHRGRELPRQRRLGHLRLQGRADRRQDAGRAGRHRPHARPHRPLRARALLRGPARVRARRRRRQPLTDHGVHREEQPRDRTGRGPQAHRGDRRASSASRTRSSSPTGATRRRSTSACSTA